jgi:hypothetical protein
VGTLAKEIGVSARQAQQYLTELERKRDGHFLQARRFLSPNDVRASTTILARSVSLE